jgi:hypothetical protein
MTPRIKTEGVAMDLELAAPPGCNNSVSVEYVGIAIGKSRPENPIIFTAWTQLEAANDFGDVPTIEACQRIIEANLSGGLPEHFDVKTIFDFFNRVAPVGVSWGFGHA